MMGISSRPTPWTNENSYTTTAVQEAIDFMNAQNLTVYRMAFGLLNGNFVDPTTCVQYFLTHCNHTLVLDYYHTNPNGFGSTMSEAEWQASTTQALSILSKFESYQERLWIEPYNERAGCAPRTQGFIDAIRDVGYTNPVVANRWWSDSQNSPYADFAQIIDPLDKFYSGEHKYFNDTTLTRVISQETIGLNLGLKMMDTEVGAHTLEYPQFTESLVASVSSYLQWASQQNNVSVCVWMCNGARNWLIDSPTSYKNLNLIFPAMPTPVTLPYHNPLTALDNLSIINGTWSVQT